MSSSLFSAPPGGRHTAASLQMPRLPWDVLSLIFAASASDQPSLARLGHVSYDFLASTVPLLYGSEVRIQSLAQLEQLFCERAERKAVSSMFLHSSSSASFLLPSLTSCFVSDRTNLSDRRSSRPLPPANPDLRPPSPYKRPRPSRPQCLRLEAGRLLTPPPPHFPSHFPIQPLQHPRIAPALPSPPPQPARMLLRRTEQTPGASSVLRPRNHPSRPLLLDAPHHSHSRRMHPSWRLSPGDRSASGPSPRLPTAAQAQQATDAASSSRDAPLVESARHVVFPQRSRGREYTLWSL